MVPATAGGWREAAPQEQKREPMSKLQSNLAVVLCGILFAPSARADLQFNSVGILAAESVNNVSGMHQYGVLLRYRVNSQSKKLWMPNSLDLAVGSLEHRSDAGSFISFGPSYRFHIRKFHAGRWFMDFGVHPTWLTRTEFRERPLGGNFHFTSYLGLGAYLGRQRRTSVLVRYQHTSNAGIDHPNPGLDMIGLTFNYHFGGDQQLFSAEAAK